MTTRHGSYYAPKASRRERNAGCEGLEERSNVEHNGRNQCKNGTALNDSGQLVNGTGLSTPAHNFHPTVKPLSLCRYLLTLLRQPTVNLVLDPFMGSGSTGVACAQLGIPFVGIERDADYFEIAKRRIEAIRPLEPLFSFMEEP